MIEQTANTAKKDPEQMSSKEFAALPREQKIEHIIELLDKLGLVIHEKPKPEPVPEIEFDFTGLNAEETVLMTGFSTALDEIAAGMYEDWMQTVTKSMKIPRQSRFACIALGYAAGFLHGFGAQTSTDQKRAGDSE